MGIETKIPQNIKEMQPTTCEEIALEITEAQKKDIYERLDKKLAEIQLYRGNCYSLPLKNYKR